MAGALCPPARMEAGSWAPRRWPCPPGIVLLALASVLSSLLSSGQARVYSRCELARVLQDFGLEGYRGYSLADCKDPDLSLLLPLPPPHSRAVALGASVLLFRIRILRTDRWRTPRTGVNTQQAGDGLLLWSRPVMSDSLRPQWTAARQASLSLTISKSLPKFMSAESVLHRNLEG